MAETDIRMDVATNTIVGPKFFILLGKPLQAGNVTAGMTGTRKCENY
jgi:hypothetical protein